MTEIGNLKVGNEKIEFDRKKLEEGISYIVNEAYALGRFDEETTDFEQAIKKWVDTRGTYELGMYELDKEEK